MTDKRTQSVLARFSQTFSSRTSSMTSRKEKQLGYKGEVSLDARNLASQLNLLAQDYEKFKKREAETRREQKKDLVEEVEHLIDIAKKLESLYTKKLADTREIYKKGLFARNPKMLVKKSDPGKLNRKSSAESGESDTASFPMVANSPSKTKRKTHLSSGVSDVSRKFELINMVPLEEYLKSLTSMIEAMDARLKAINKASSDMEVRIKRCGSVCGVYNPLSGQVDWKEFENGGVCGVWNPIKEEIEWREKKGHGVHGVWNPRTKEIEWKMFKNGGVYGVWNPLIQDIDWRQSYREGVCGVWNPVFEAVQFETFRNGGIIGYFDEASQDVIWKRKTEHGVCVIRKIGDNDYETICSSISNWFRK